jgi:FixJ family two-component response regulator
MPLVNLITDVSPVSRIPFQHSSSPAPRGLDKDLGHHVIHLVDDKQHVRAKLSRFLTELGMKVIAFASAGEYLAFNGKETAGCLILNTHLPDFSGLDLLRRIGESRNPPIIFISEEADITFVVSAMKAGALDFLTWPCEMSALIEPIRTAFAQTQRRYVKNLELAQLKGYFARLTPRERQVLSLVVSGLPNKQAAAVLGISEVTLQIHRSQVMRKMEAGSLAELVRMSIRLHIRPWRKDLYTDSQKAGTEVVRSLPPSQGKVHFVYQSVKPV